MHLFLSITLADYYYIFGSCVVTLTVIGLVLTAASVFTVVASWRLLKEIAEHRLRIVQICRILHLVLGPIIRCLHHLRIYKHLLFIWSQRPYIS